MSVQTGLAPKVAKTGGKLPISVCTCGGSKKRHPSNTSQWICERGEGCPDGNGVLKPQFSMMDAPPKVSRTHAVRDGNSPFGTSWERY